MAPTKFERVFAAYSSPYGPKYGDERGGNIILPPSALDQLLKLPNASPMLFQLLNPSTGRTTHCGVLEFVAEEGKMLLPAWMLVNLEASEGDLIQVTFKPLSKGTFVKLQPETSNFLKVSNPRVVLERALRAYSAVSKNDRILIPYGSQRFYMKILETKPHDNICIIQTDLEVDFAPPLDYVEPSLPQNTQPMSIPNTLGGRTGDTTPVSPSNTPDTSKPSSFSGAGYRLDGRPSSMSSSPHVNIGSPSNQMMGASPSSPPTAGFQRGPTTGTPSGKMVFGSPSSPPIPHAMANAANLAEKKSGPSAPANVGSPKDDFKPFSGKGYSLK
eukprot:TRINITY_DN466_c0_g1_i7.p1 TRINITY_DN466_c0_g1~~TRINITY_DN466_c0_g1_i7.p1  ORF type:complete len:329 (-),score=54.88 TRINITY_DN466_c0_g1_i7:395-1381(-)